MMETPAVAQPTLDDSRVLQVLLSSGVLSELDYYFAQTLASCAPEEDPWVFVGAALASRAVQAGHVCLDIQAFLNCPLLDKDEKPIRLSFPPLAEWCAKLSASAVVTKSLLPESDPLPLVFEAPGRLYLHRYAQYQRRLVSALGPKLQAHSEVDESLLLAGLDRLFPSQQRASHADDQRLAAALAVRNRFTVISGGPGTGKTTTVTKILLLLQEQALAQTERAERVLLLAPTGKAAQRLSESIEQSLSMLTASGSVPSQLSDSIDREARTIHRALGYQRRTPTRFRHGLLNPLHAGIVLVDEASMVDLALMTKLLESISPKARVILLGDKDQLASVEAGAILGDIFNAEAPHEYSPQTAAFLTRVCRQAVPEAAPNTPSRPIADCTVLLKRSYRYDDGSAIGVLARAVRDGNLRAMQDTLLTQKGGVKFIETRKLNNAQRAATLKEVFRAGYDEYARTKDPEEQLAQLGRFRLLSPHRQGPIGVGALNELATDVLRPLLGGSSAAESYAGRAIMVTENDYQMDLFNGDVGVIGRNPDGTRLFAFFVQQGKLRRVQLSRLPPHETVFAMTVHKSQGSEFDAVALVLPLEPSPVFTRELIYTGITRARSSVTLVGTAPVLEQGLETRIQRASGLREALWG